MGGWVVTILGGLAVVRMEMAVDGLRHKVLQLFQCKIYLNVWQWLKEISKFVPNVLKLLLSIKRGFQILLLR